jgi:hypothetical protein
LLEACKNLFNQVILFLNEFLYFQNINMERYGPTSVNLRKNALSKCLKYLQILCDKATDAIVNTIFHMHRTFPP